jgi:adenylosuccinate lyase
MKPIVLPEISHKKDYNVLDPLDCRYFDAEVAKYLSEESRIAYQAHVEAALAQTLADFKICTQAVADEIEVSARKVSADEVYKQEEVTKHDIKALVNVIKSRISDQAKPYVHYGATSNDIISTATALQMRDVTQQVVIPRLRELLQTLLRLSEQYASTVQIGRTHGQHAVPITFGFAMAEYVSRLGNSMAAIQGLSEELKGKFSGAVGAYNALSIFIDDPIKFEETLLAKLKIQPAPYSTQIVPPEFLIRLIDELAITSGIMANLSHDMRHLQRSEIAEVRERFEKGQTGSSTMAHKRNPINFENVISMNKQVVAQTVNAIQNISSEHQRDLTDSASIRFYSLVPAIIASMTKRLDRVMQKIEVDDEAMQRNLKLSGGAIAAEPLYLLFEKYGHTAAHEKVKELAHKALSQGKPLIQLLKNDKEAFSYWNRFTFEERKIIERPEKYYTGLAEKKSLMIIGHWQKIIGKK